MKKLFLALIVAVCALSVTAGAAEKKKHELTTEQKEFATKHDLLKDGHLDKEAVGKLSAEDKATFEKLFPHGKKKKE
ncbi:MAG: hypothetical protein HY301_19140 [Verrucomicrobia bacterium]|nr:hypothetical protein [Verrucomicrobiota bacterium]